MKVAYITGTTRGLGKALASVYLENGWEVARLSRPSFDLLRPDLGRIVKGWREAVFINNAATVLVAPHFTGEEIDNELTVNLISPIRLIQRFIETNPRGLVVNVTSGLARESLPHFDLYCTAKAGMEAYLRSLQCRGVRCINFDPGVMDTAMQERLRKTNHPSRSKFVEFYEAGRLRDPLDVARSLFEHATSSSPQRA